MQVNNTINDLERRLDLGDDSAYRPMEASQLFGPALCRSLDGCTAVCSASLCLWHATHMPDPLFI